MDYDEAKKAAREMINSILDVVEWDSVPENPPDWSRDNVFDVTVVIRERDESNATRYHTVHVGPPEEITTDIGHDEPWCLAMNVAVILFGGATAVNEGVHSEMDTQAVLRRFIGRLMTAQAPQTPN